MNTKTMLVLTIAALAACSGDHGGKLASDKGIPNGLIVREITGEPISVIDLVTTKGNGDQVIVLGRIGGRAEPFAKNRAMFQLIDDSLESCIDLGDDRCPTPQDYCCTPPETIEESSVTVQVLGTNDKPLPMGLEGLDGLESLSTLIISGSVSKSDDGSTMITAERIMVAKPAPRPGSGGSDHDHDHDHDHG